MKYLCPPKNSYVEILSPNMVTLGGGAFGRRLSHVGRALMNGISALIRRKTREISLSVLYEDK